MYKESIGYIFSLAKKSLRLRSAEPEALSPRGDLWSALAGGGGCVLFLFSLDGMIHIRLVNYLARCYLHLRVV